MVTFSRLFNKSQLKGLPHHGIGRVCKVGKEQLVGLLVALRLFAEDSIQEQYQKNLVFLNSIIDKLDPKFKLLVEIVRAPDSEDPFCILGQILMKLIQQ